MHFCLHPMPIQASWLHGLLHRNQQHQHRKHLHTSTPSPLPCHSRSYYHPQALNLVSASRLRREQWFAAQARAVGVLGQARLDGIGPDDLVELARRETVGLCMRMARMVRMACDTCCACMGHGFGDLGAHACKEVMNRCVLST